jgi:uncharacterized membrane protein YeaQ/YmgE (transglycosylase-associated protein family)
MSIFGWIVLGGLAGWLASILAGKNSSMGLFMNVIVGIFGAFVGGFIFKFINGASVTGFNLTSLLVAFVGALVLLLIGNLFNRK